MDLSVCHRTAYRYGAPVRTLTQSLRLWPSQYDGQDTHAWDIRIEGHEASRGAAFRDGAGDWIETVAMRGVSAVDIVVEGRVTTRDLTGVLRGLREKVPPEAYLRATDLTRTTEALAALAHEVSEGEADALSRAHAIANSVRERIVYTTGATAADTTAGEALEIGKGVCQDQAHAVIAMARALDLPGRYAVGYLFASEDSEMTQASHAWAEVYIDGLGWVGFDAANGQCPDDRYVRLGSGLDARAAAPIRGRATGGGAETLTVDVTVAETATQQ